MPRPRSLEQDESASDAEDPAVEAMAQRKLLMIPGPVELAEGVQAVLGRPQESHLAPEFIAAFGRALRGLRTLAGSRDAIAAIIPGTGTLAMEFATANLVEAGDNALVVNTGYFSDRFAQILERQGARVSQVRAEPGAIPDLEEVEKALAERRYKLMTVTHVDTSTGVRAPVAALAALAKRSETLVVVDAVCALGGEALTQDAWKIDVVLSASQKAIAAPPGLALATFSQRALAARRERQFPPPSLYLDLEQWLPILAAYEKGESSYFATPAVNLVSALDASLERIFEEGIAPRVARHQRLAHAFREGMRALQLELLPEREASCASTLSAVNYPKGIGPNLIEAIGQQGVQVAGGLLPARKASYFRVGHMGCARAQDILAVAGAIERALASLGHRAGSAVAAVEAALTP